ncbi:peptide-methionine (S)-S-oxide reductase MsrA [Candidatus Uabimicrobium sp. HlEnr_7]|uniref:peptide-methionine (S)-S-oxide reductase MsrA n=1 Tax=Candidatus Uabimicrobium helgolandensis TaxID=3095367 RepID=UPI003557099E
MRIMLLMVCCLLPLSCQEAVGVVNMDHNEEVKKMNDPKLKTATFGGGCFWCVEAIFQQVKGVHSVISGYSGGVKENPTYNDILSKKTKHAEVCQIKYDPKEVSFSELLEVFWKTHDPTTLNKQGNDVGPQYRSIILYHSDEQKEIAEKYKQKLQDAKAWSNPIVTEIKPLTKFYSAEKYHQNYYSLNPNQGYCAWVIQPKIEKFRKVFKDKLSDKAKTK